MKQFKIFLLILLVLNSCDLSKVYENHIEIKEGIWNRYNRVTFNVPISDTLSTHNIFINIRHDSYYPRSNLFLFITTTAPNGNSVKDTFQIVLADNKGKWYGKGIGDIWSRQQPYKINVRFPVSGEYIFKCEQAMRMIDLPHIMDVGLIVEKAK